MKSFMFIPDWKNILKLSLTFCLALFALALFAQTSEPAPEVNYPELYSLLVGALTMSWGYIAKALGLKRDFPRFVYVVIAGAIVIVGIFLALGFGDGISHAIAVFTSMGIFDLLKGTTKN